MTHLPGGGSPRSLLRVILCIASTDHIEVASLAERIVGGAMFVGVAEDALVEMATRMVTNSSSCGDSSGIRNYGNTYISKVDSVTVDPVKT